MTSRTDRINELFTEFNKIPKGGELDHYLNTVRPFDSHIVEMACQELESGDGTMPRAGKLKTACKKLSELHTIIPKEDCFKCGMDGMIKRVIYRSLEGGKKEVPNYDYMPKSGEMFYTDYIGRCGCLNGNEYDSTAYGTTFLKSVEPPNYLMVQANIKGTSANKEANNHSEKLNKMSRERV